MEPSEDALETLPKKDADSPCTAVTRDDQKRHQFTCWHRSHLIPRVRVYSDADQSVETARFAGCDPLENTLLYADLEERETRIRIQEMIALLRDAASRHSISIRSDFSLDLLRSWHAVSNYNRC